VKIILITLAVVAFLGIRMYIFCRWFTSPPAASQQVVVGVLVPPVPLNQWPASINNNNNTSSNIGCGGQESN
jgi:hypothetical protein